MRQRLAVVAAGAFVAVLVAAAVPLVAGCGIGGHPVTVSGPFGRQPAVSFGDAEPGEELSVWTPIEGTGAKVARGDVLIANYVDYRWGDSGHKLIASNYAGGGHPSAFPVGRLLPGLNRALAGKRVGSRVVAVVPPKDGYGDGGNAQLEITGDDSVVFVFDLIATYPRHAAVRGPARPQVQARLPKVGAAPPGGPPAVTIPRTRPPDTPAVSTVISGSGRRVEPGRLLALQYVGVFWRNGRTFDSSWASGQVYTTTIGTRQVIKGWDEGLVGRRVGSRVLLVVPPAWGYGPRGLRQAGIRGGDTLVFVVDILGAH